MILLGQLKQVIAEAGALRRAGLACFALLVLATTQLPAQSYDYLARTLADDVDGETPVRIGMGDFVYAQTRQQSPFSTLLRMELENALAKTDVFEIITYDRLDELEELAEFQQLSIVDMGGISPDLKIAGVDGIVRGRYFYKYPYVTVFAELVWLDTGRVSKARVEISVDHIAADLFPGADGEVGIAPETGVVPYAANASEANRLELEQSMVPVPEDFTVSLALAQNKTNFNEGDQIVLSVKTAQDACVAVLYHQVDGTSLMLYPNALQPNSFLEAGKTLYLPGGREQAYRLVAGPPFGTDVIQVIACTERNVLFKLLEWVVADNPGTPYPLLNRALVAAALNNALQHAGSAGPQWGSASLSISTFPSQL